MVNVVMAVSGVVLLVLGWKLFWLFVGVVGFAAGLQAAQLYFGPHPFWVLWAVGLVCGIIGAVLALFFQKLAIGIGGFVAGSTIALHLSLMMGYDPGALVALIGGILGAVALYLLFDWALIILSSVAGAALIIEALGRHAPYAPVLSAVLVAAGVIFQARLLMVSRKGES
ncbi:MAG: TMEM198/TM7SF3 family protein [Deltaproteobacteria bacterium]|nr:TMEM198/TM7SF3 family protein [Deltaproteobacteria bacterium]